MAGYQVNLDTILGLLMDNPRGLNIREVAELTGTSRISAAKYLDVLAAEGKVEVRSMGKAKVFYVVQVTTPPSLFEHAPGMILVLGADGRIIQANDRFLKYCSLSTEQVSGQPLTAIFRGILKEPVFLRSVEEVFRTRSPLADIIIDVLPEDARFKVTIKPAPASGDRFGLIVMINDITGEKKTMPGNTVLSGDAVLAFIEEIGIPACIVQGGRIRAANTRFAALIGYSRNDFRARSVLEFVHPEDRDVVLAFLKGPVQEKTLAAAGPFRCIAKSGSDVWTDARAVPFLWKKEPASLIFCVAAGNNRTNGDRPGPDQV